MIVGPMFCEVTVTVRLFQKGKATGRIALNFMVKVKAG